MNFEMGPLIGRGIYTRDEMKLSRIFFLLLFAMPAAHAADLPQRFEEGVRVLASDEMEGRGLGTAGIEKAAYWIEGRLREIGLEPAFGASYRQAFPVKTGVALADGNKMSVTNLTGIHTTEEVAEADWIPLGFSSSGVFSGPLVFAGYGIDAPPIGYRELEGTDIKGKVVMMLRYEPQEKDDASPFDGRK